MLHTVHKPLCLIRHNFQSMTVQGKHQVQHVWLIEIKCTTDSDVTMSRNAISKSSKLQLGLRHTTDLIDGCLDFLLLRRFHRTWFSRFLIHILIILKQIRPL